MTMIRLRHAIVAAVLAASFVSTSAFAKDSLYKRVGGYDALAAVTDDFVGRLATDKDFAIFFQGFSEDSKKRIRQNIVDLLCQATGGPCVYVGRDLKVAHAGLGITKAQWDKSVVLLTDTLNKFKVPEEEQKDLAALVLPLEKDIVEKK
jgi:hemoglobin